LFIKEVLPAHAVIIDSKQYLQALYKIKDECPVQTFSGT
jgi:hypothetical protein